MRRELERGCDPQNVVYVWLARFLLLVSVQVLAKKFQDLMTRNVSKLFGQGHF